MSIEESIRAQLATVKYPGYSRDIVSFGMLQSVQVNQGAAHVVLHLSTAKPEIAQQLKQECEGVIRSVPGIASVFVEIKVPAAAPSSAPGNQWSNQNSVPGIGRIVAVASGKGGVGKSTCSVNIACALHHLGLKVGLLDCDIYGPSIPLMMGVKGKPQVTEDENLIPLERSGIKLMSMGFLIEGDTPVIWRGPMIMKTIQQFLLQVAWGELDVLIVDLPPGTGDAQLSLCQTVPLTGGIIVTTPQEASLGVVRKGMAMFQKVNVPLLGIVENMSYFITPSGDRVEIFGHGGGSAEASRQGIPFLGEIPLYTEIRMGGDEGEPVVLSSPDTPPAQAFIQVAKKLMSR